MRLISVRFQRSTLQPRSGLEKQNLTTLPIMMGVLDALASYVQNMLMEMAKEEVHILLGVTREIENMGVKLRDLKNFLADADRRNITDLSVQAWVKELRHAMYGATDILDLCQLKAMEKGPSHNMGCFSPLLFCMRNPLHAHDIGRRIKKLNENLDAIKARSASFNFINLGSFEDRGKNMVSPNSGTRETSWGLDESSLVGEKIEEDMRNLVGRLTQEHQTYQKYRKIMVFAIVGVGGIGKTTLAQKIFNNEIIKQEFSKKLWLSVNQDFDQIEILRRAVMEAGADHLATGNTKATLERVLTDALKGHKTILIMDDVWDHRVWEGVLRTPLVNATLGHGSCVLVTTRHDTVAQGMLAEKPYHRINKLEPEDAWLLLKKQVVGNENNDEQKVDTLRHIGMEIIAKCDGLPLAVKVMGGLLRQRKTWRSDWENVLNDSIWSLFQMPTEINNAVYLSYQDLHPILKPCFLHYALLPKSKLFWANTIVAMWISEGFVHGKSCDLEVLGNEYYNELIARNLIEPDQWYVDQRVCNMHDVVRSFAQYVVRQEALIAHESEAGLTDKLNSQNVIRLSLQTKESESNEVAWSSIQEHISLRTLILVGKIKINPSDSLSSLSCLRTLHIDGGNFDALSEYLVKLKHLRYLSIRGTDTSTLPENIAEMKFLQHIDLVDCEHLERLPSGIGKLQQLRYLALNGTGIGNVPKGFHGLTNLKILYGFPVHIDADWCSLEELGPLNQLMDLEICGLEKVLSSSSAMKARLGEKLRLRNLYMSWTIRCGDEDDDHQLQLVADEDQGQIEKVFNELRPPPCLEKLSIDGYLGQRLPRWMMSATVAPLGSLRILAMDDLARCTELPNGLCELPCLEFLQIRRAPAIKIVGREFICSSHSQKLVIVKCPKMKVLEGMAALQRLNLEDYDMETVPRYLQDVKPRYLLLECSLSLLTCIAAGKSSPEWDKFNHIQQVKAYAHGEDGPRKWYVLYTREPFRFETNISRYAIRQASMNRTALAYLRTCPVEEGWLVGRCSYTDKPLPLCELFRCNAYRHLVGWLGQACQHCREAPRIASPSDQWIQAAVALRAPSYYKT
ncbi:hypothetical protein BS78_05G076100 [Paspalum vaginatum]|nr:hypothetical protein BS78_05G076100 [Paspalum vaginatum]